MRPKAVRSAVRTIFTLIAASCLGQPYPAPVDSLPQVPDFPDPLVMADGSPVRSPEDWYGKRVPELRNLFQHYMYGFPPPAPGEVRATVRRTNPAAFGGEATCLLYTSDAADEFR
ncbi:MAG: hypothetical protein QUS35_08970, partial [bacterium]|nr:hypothetical protein [bacterium]